MGTSTIITLFDSEKVHGITNQKVQAVPVVVRRATPTLHSRTLAPFKGARVHGLTAACVWGNRRRRSVRNPRRLAQQQNALDSAICLTQIARDDAESISLHQDDLSKSSTPLLTPSPQSTPPQATERASHVATATSAAQQSRDEDDTSSVEVVAASPTPTSEEEGDDRSTPRLETPVSDKGSSAVNGGGSRSSDLRSSTSSSPRDSPVFARDQKSSVIESTTTTTVIKNTTLTTGADRTDGSGSYDVQKAYDVQINNSEVRRISDLQPPPQRGGAVLAPPQPAARQAAVVHVENNGTSQNGAAAPVRNGGSLPPPGADGLNLTMKASELRELLRSRKKKDPRETQMDLRQKYKIIEQM
ncbi:hypothetical protein HPB49_014927 [Dermacentor silvarum]|uniref:Uncharacterized protein n=1 Tax=Dermacentor silvarum TaxID=543639 RepID=A0ACB8DJL6_DERSI|nr:hypothetical protein HPB49_014927 [Dermacentor silvarum]